MDWKGTDFTTTLTTQWLTKLLVQWHSDPPAINHSFNITWNYNKIHYRS